MKTNINLEEYLKGFISPKELCSLLNITRVTLDNWTRKKAIKKYWIGGICLYKKSEIVKLIEKATK